MMRFAGFFASLAACVLLASPPAHAIEAPPRDRTPILAGLSVSVGSPLLVASALNIHTVITGRRTSDAWPVIGMFAGGFAVLLGASIATMGDTGEEDAVGVSLLGVGVTSAALGGWALSHPKTPRLSVLPTVRPGPDGQAAFAVSVGGLEW